MTTADDPNVLPHWRSSALITIDMQRDFLSDSPYGLAGTTEVIPAIAGIAGAYRASGWPIVHIVRFYRPGGSNAELVRRSLLASGVDIVAPGSPGSELAPGLVPPGAPGLDHEHLLAGGVQEIGPAEYVIFKPRWGAFFQTPLQGLLEGLEIDTVVFTGCNFPNCPRASLVEASERDYRVVLVPDAVSQVNAQGLEEIRRIGVQLVTAGEVVAALTAVGAGS